MISYVTGSLSPKSWSLASTWTTLAPWEEAVGGGKRERGEERRRERAGGRREEGREGRGEQTHNGIPVYLYWML